MTSDVEMFRPMLSASLPSAKGKVPTEEEVRKDLGKLYWGRGFFASPKLDGIRAVKHPEHGLVTRTLTPIPNRFIQECLAHPLFNQFDGELVIGDLEGLVEFNDSQSGIMSRDGSPFFTYCVFDDITQPTYRFDYRNDQARRRIEVLHEHINFQNLFKVVHVEQKLVMSLDELLEYETDLVARGYEGVIFRDPGMRYKNNRGTFKEQGMIKLKRFVDAEAVIVGFEELQRNGNTAETDLRGYTKRSSALAGQVAGGTLGKLLVKGTNGRFANSHFAIGSGFKAEQRDDIWDRREYYMGKQVKYKYQDAGSKNLPRAPIFLGFRPEGA